MVGRRFLVGALIAVVLAALATAPAEAAPQRHGGYLALGDSESDIGMIRMAGAGVAMSDAHAEVRAVADWVAPRADESGLAAAVQRFVLAAG